MKALSMPLPQMNFNGVASSLDYFDATPIQDLWFSKLNWMKISVWTGAAVFNFISWHLALKLIF